MKSNHVTPKGRILKVKQGYNPNSSSIGSGILPFLAFAAGAGVFTIFLANTLEAVGKLIKKASPPAPDPGDKNHKNEEDA